ncbi:hypothetical protein RRG08_035060 [Elysia crispata]|uniref:Uncharacterized protein n=1 Tax=Elysia crispata TaxID=231223 RepID=A0AAE1DLB4_9GAST|nr:hypothetical protein RRG08_035060 [Elysia crispata]
MLLLVSEENKNSINHKRTVPGAERLNGEGVAERDTEDGKDYIKERREGEKVDIGGNNPEDKKTNSFTDKPSPSQPTYQTVCQDHRRSGKISQQTTIFVVGEQDVVTSTIWRPVLIRVRPHLHISLKGHFGAWVVSFHLHRLARHQSFRSAQIRNKKSRWANVLEEKSGVT